MSNRYELFTQVHKGLRYKLCNLSSRAGSLNVLNDDSFTVFLNDFQRLAVVLHSHAEHEDSFVQPLVDKFAPGLSERLEHEHTSTEEILVHLETELPALTNLPHNQRKTAWNDWSHKYNQFVAKYFNHLQTEEVDVMAVLWEHMTDEQLDEVSINLRSSIPPDEMAVYLSYMLPGMNIFERVAMLSQMKKFAPPQVFEGVCQLAQSVLTETEWKELEQDLTIA